MQSFQEFVQTVMAHSAKRPEQVDQYTGNLVRGPRMPGQYQSNSTILARLSRQQLHDLARAYGVEVMPNGTKGQILPALEMAEQAGIFNGPVKSLYHLEKAARDRDQMAVPLTYPNPDLAPAVKEPVTGQPFAATELDTKTLRRLCKEGGMNVFQKSRKDMEAFLESRREP